MVQHLVYNETMVGKMINKKEVAQGTLQVTFETQEPFTFKPGQYVFVKLNSGKRQFSINNTPNQKGIIIITTRLSDSGFKKVSRRWTL